MQGQNGATQHAQGAPHEPSFRGWSALTLTLSPGEREQLRSGVDCSERSFAKASAIWFTLSPQRGLELLGQQLKEFAEGKGPLRAERAGASESLGRGEG